MENFKFMGIDNEPYKSNGSYNKEESLLLITFDSVHFTRRFTDFKEENKIIEQISFFGDERSSSYYGPYKVSKIKDNEVTLKIISN
ncbi:hypothetical protein MHB48_15155 [Psychrobacillus sp. FSL H8-0483]|uniref:hypothetical protein n=1 Tax=Psychrobacillus sp. FSL H8-0483 TaxID=2921389 RepID=UPI00315AB666